jgi:hypothetical protein
VQVEELDAAQAVAEQRGQALDAALLGVATSTVAPAAMMASTALPSIWL